VGYVSETANNVRGGAEEKTRYTDQWSFGSKLDLQKLLGWHAAAFELVITDRDGRNLSDDAQLHTLQAVQEVYGRGQTWRLTRLSYRQSWFDGGLDLKVGRLPEGDDFAAFPCNFQNLTFCGSQPGNVRGDLWYSAPVSQWGSRVKVGLSAETSVQLGVFQVNPRYVDDGYAHHGALYPNNPAGTTGALIPLEYGWKPTFGGLPGSYKVGAWYDTSKANDVFLDTNHQPIALTGGMPLQRDSRSGVYLSFQQQVNGRDKGPGGSVFLNITQSDKATAPSMDRQVAVGITYKGPFDARPGDTLGLAVGSNHVNSRVADGVRLSNQYDGGAEPVPGSESVGELFYAWVPRPFITLQPNLQYVRHPGGVSTNESVVVVGLRCSVDF
jgi:porin